MKKDRLTRFVCAALVLVLMLCSVPCAFAEEEPEGIIDDRELTALVESFMGERGLSNRSFSLGFWYSGTDESWYYNGDAWFYPASMYKVPLIMLLSERVKNGELTQETEIGGYPVSTIEEYILTYSNNDWAHTIRAWFGGDEVWRQDARQYATLTEDEYDPDYMQYCYFSNRYMTEVMRTLFTESERFPNVIECLLEAEPSHFFRRNMEGRFRIAQKYGSYTEGNGDDYNNATGIIYTENPCIVTVMTRNVSNYETVIAEAGELLTEYALQLDNRLAAYRADLEAKAEEQRRLEEEKQAELEKEKKIEEKRQTEAANAQKAIQQQTAKQDARKQRSFSMIAVIAALVLLIVLITAVVNRRRRKAREKRYKEYSLRYEAEQRARDSVRDRDRSYTRR